MPRKSRKLSPVERARDAMIRIRAERGVPSRIAEAVDVTVSAVMQWHMVPVEYVEKVSAVTGIPPHRIRPDHYVRP